MSTGIVRAATLYVNCGAKAGLNSIGAALKALQYSDDRGPATINVAGACKENLLIQNVDRLTLNALQGASITDASGGLKDLIDVNNSNSFTLRGFTLTGGVDTVSCYYQSHCLLVQNTISGGTGNAIAVYPTSTAFVVGGVVQNSGFNGLLVRGDVIAAGVLAQNNGTNGAAVQEGGRLLFRPSDPAFDGVTVSTPAVIQNNQFNGIRAVRGATLVCRGCVINGNTQEGVHLELTATASFEAYFFTNSSTETTISGNGGSGVNVRDLSNAAFFNATSVTGNAQPDITCNTPTSVTANALGAAGGSAHTNCTN
ncbi:MAG: hypothetical protein C5B58_08990 [Acidobacteria bacterium]|nr:MAG: hypothetical protein C5B58_08990 [Acidobacteriota bacterium]